MTLPRIFALYPWAAEFEACPPMMRLCGALEVHEPIRALVEGTGRWRVRTRLLARRDFMFGNLHESAVTVFYDVESRIEERRMRVALGRCNAVTALGVFFRRARDLASAA